MKQVNIHPHAIEELACKLIGIDYEEIGVDTSLIEEELDEKFDVDLDELKVLIDHLIPLIQIGRSPLTDILYKGFGDNGVMIVKAEV
ncbi:hypothetical protein [Myroides marinus]|uniref:hypothetical protein n=1 Tax=Myroides TaxID=76831 RepID=UPI002577027F|nr:hypothetical protein [Myroides marinus]MDM1378186.1 hypothetical protein [Myroides marinus]MDM1385428.1 hypothetical protein [Myroides marinus]MDM1392641.1 hypothetical protein [Myroides marinus]